ISTESARAKRSSHEPGLRERMTSPVSGSLRMKTSRGVKRKSEGKRTAWLRPFLKSLAILRMVGLHSNLSGAPCSSYTMVYHGLLESKWLGNPYTQKAPGFSGA